VSRDGSVASEKQLAVLQAIKEHTARKGYPPSYREVAETLGYASVGSVWHHVRALERHGLLTAASDRPRSIAPTKPAASPQGSDDAGAVAVPAWDGGPSLRLPRLFAGTGDFVFRMPDDSLLHRQVRRGDWIVAGSGDAKPPDLVVVSVGPGLSVRELCPDERPAMAVVRAVLRRL
jgi:SOS-response transcriptional repressor LexA